MIIISYINEGHPVFSLVEKKNVDLVVALIINKITEGATINPEDFSGKLLSVEEGRIVGSPYKVNNLIKDGVLETFEATVELYDDVAYFFDDYSCYEYNGSYKELNTFDYDITTCPCCGKKILKKDTVKDFCVDCFLERGIDEMFHSALDSSNERYTEFEKVSKVSNTLDNFNEMIEEYFNIPRVSDKAKEIVEKYIKREKIPEKYVGKIVGGFAA